MSGYVYIMTNKRRGTLYIGVTADLPRRTYGYKEGLNPGFCRRYGLTRLVFWQYFDRIEDAIQREKTMKHWVRQWKIIAIEEINPEWEDLYERLNQ